MKNKFKNAQEAFDYYYQEISNKGLIYKDTVVLFNVGILTFAKYVLILFFFYKASINH